MYGDQEHQHTEPMDWSIEETTDGDLILLLRPEDQDDFEVPLTPAMVRELIRRWTEEPAPTADDRDDARRRSWLRSVVEDA